MSVNKNRKGLNKKFIFKDDSFAFEAIHAVGYAAYGGADSACEAYLRASAGV